MAIRIESPETLALIEKISAITGKDAETVVQVAVREQTESVRSLLREHHPAPGRSPSPSAL